MPTKMTVEEIMNSLKNPAAEQTLYDAVEELREKTEPDLEAFVAVRSRADHIKVAHQTIGQVLARVLKHCDTSNGDAGHGPGHWARDCAHTLLLAHDSETPEHAIVPAMVAGTLHDIGTLFVDRYADRDKAVRHAELGALIVLAAMEDCPITEQEKLMCAYAIAAHTHYLSPTDVKCADGVTRKVKPWKDMANEQPVMGVWMPRWADRLDVNGPCFIGRHYLTLNRDHHDYSQEGFYAVSFVEHMKPLLRTNDEIKSAGGKRSMLEHVRMFSSSQTDNSVYGKYDRGLMRKLRDSYREQLEVIVDQVANPTDVDVERVMAAWTVFCFTNIEPNSKKAVQAAADLTKGFSKLDADTQRAWANGFRATMFEYISWSNRMASALDRLEKGLTKMPRLFESLQKVIRPDPTWVSVLMK